jgi:hypothetical protein
MLSGKKAPVILNTSRNYQRELKQLYARRSAIDALIASLVAYDRYKAASAATAGQHRKSA